MVLPNKPVSTLLTGLFTGLLSSNQFSFIVRALHGNADEQIFEPE